MELLDYHGGNRNKRYYLNSIDEMPERLRSKFAQEFIFRDEVYDDFFANNAQYLCFGARYIYSYGHSSNGKSPLVSLSDHIITYKYKTGSVLTIFCDSLFEAISVWDKLVGLPVLRMLDNVDEALGAHMTATTKTDVKIPVSEYSDYDDVYKDNVIMKPEEFIVIPKGEVWYCEYSKYDHPGKTWISWGKSIRDLGYHLIAKRDGAPCDYIIQLPYDYKELNLIDNGYFYNFDPLKYPKGKTTLPKQTGPLF